MEGKSVEEIGAYLEMYLFSNFGFEAGNVSLDLNTSDSKSELADSSIKTTHNEITTKN